ncbi:MAG: hypothetical protein R3C24_12880 [Cyanobacteriota/Melainabacteria group bacterium]
MPKEVVLEHVIGVGARNFAQRFVQRQRGQILAFSIFVDLFEEHTL